jgi:hypothetical protein
MSAITPRTNIKDIPIEFVFNNMTKYQKELLELKFYIFNRFACLRSTKMKKIDIYYRIAEEISLQPDTVNKIYNSTCKKIILSVVK